MPEHERADPRRGSAFCILVAGRDLFCPDSTHTHPLEVGPGNKRTQDWESTGEAMIGPHRCRY